MSCYKIRRNVNHSINRPSLRDLVNYPKKRDGLGYTVSKHPLVYLTYTGENVSKVEQFCAPFKVEKTKRFERNKRITVQLESRMVAVNVTDVILQISSGIFMVLKEEAFKETFYG